MLQVLTQTFKLIGWKDIQIYIYGKSKHIGFTLRCDKTSNSVVSFLLLFPLSSPNVFTYSRYSYESGNEYVAVFSKVMAEELIGDIIKNRDFLTLLNECSIMVNAL